MHRERDYTRFNLGRRGRPRMSWLDNIKSWTGLEMREMLRLTEDRKRWRKIVHDAAEPRDEDS